MLFYLQVASWISDDDVTDNTNTSAKIVYTTAECVVPDGLMIQLNINVSSITPSCVSYETDTAGMFSLTELQPNTVVAYTLQVVSASQCGGSGIPIGMSRTGNFKVSSTPSPSETPTSSPSETPTPSPSESPTPSPTVSTGTMFCRCHFNKCGLNSPLWSTCSPLVQARGTNYI